MSKSRQGKSSRSGSVEEPKHLSLNCETAAAAAADAFAAATAPTEAEYNCLAVRNETTMPSSPPPSYEHVLEETRMEKAEAREDEEEDEEEDCKNQQKKKKNKDDGGTGGTERAAAKRPEILHKSSKEFYRAMAKQWGITCKMSDHCRCFDCQSHYFDCEYEKDEQEKSDGGLSAGTPMFISEVIHGTACVLL